ncbi:LysM peptidoglycan-binding domain-containing protein [Hymenobacter weizhouensis]|uniref:LysM peptidoglycan-binding domain-containing protein n=1 Tax=Hymenobacter sp. YIM 151500-1 TaxID=2987689 RepID=UPI0022271205|nr:LysM peptidoglycan-binding domain-containing protein [Hymenobacter sp. YIM 151500-1]UYZ63162.1 LysM peptidoglycan-binding domain-containing protein [Hymenobacter sp. YIM 151500-1]
MRISLSAPVVALALGLLWAQPGHAQQTESTSTPTPPPLSEDSVRVMSGLVQRSVQQLRAIYFEPNDARAVQLVDQALVEIPVLNQRLSHYTASLSREQQQELAQRLRRQPWQVELNTLLRSPQYKGFTARAAKNPALKAAADRLQTAGFLGTVKPAPSAATAVATPAAVPASVAAAASASMAAPAPKAQPATAPVSAKPVPASAVAAAKPQAVSSAPTAASVAGSPASKLTSTETNPKPTAPKPAAATRHTVQKGETLFSIARQYGVTPAQLQEWNGKTTEKVKIGEELQVKATK